MRSREAIAIIDLTAIRMAIVTGLKAELGIPVILSNQTAEAPPYPYMSYTITALMNSNNGTWGEYGDGKHRKPFTQVWSITVQSDKSSEAMELCIKARDWIDHIGSNYLHKKNIIVQSVTGISNRDNLITLEYEYRYGFDVTLWLFNETGDLLDIKGTIEEVDIKNITNS